MGLDMYLEARRYISNYRAADKPIREAMQVAISDRGTMEINGVVCEAAYWRKANAIHKWFVDNIQEGTDDCATYVVSREMLTKLRDTCKEVLNDNSLAPKLLPSRSGFFFGSVEFDEDYYADLDYTVSRIDELLTDAYKMWNFSYRSSW